MTIESKPFNRSTEKSFSRSGKINFNSFHRRTRIDMDAVNMMKAEEGKYMHFIPFENLWYVAVNDDDAGYKLSRSANRAGMCLNNMKFIRWFFTKSQIRSESVSFLLLPAENLEWHGVPLFQITKIL